MSDDLRFERKAHVQDLSFGQVRRMVAQHPAGFRTLHPPRFVNNVYFDTPLLSHYHANVEGLEDREKVRLRWYGEPEGEIEGGRLEFKIKRNLLGRKEAFGAPAFRLDRPFDAERLTDVLLACDLPPARRAELTSLQPTLLNRYRREYWASRCGRFRLTLDRDLEFHRLRRFRNRLLARAIDRESVVVELKYDPDADDKADRITGVFPFFVNKISKYCRGLESFGF